MKWIYPNIFVWVNIYFIRYVKISFKNYVYLISGIMENSWNCDIMSHDVQAKLNQ